MREEAMPRPEPQPGPLGSLAAVNSIVPFAAAAASDRLGWVGLESARYVAAPDSDFDLPPLSHHWLILLTRPPEKLDLLYDGVRRHVPPAAGSILLVPAGSATHWRWSGGKASLHIHLPLSLVERVAAEAFELDPSRLSIPPLDGVQLPQLRAAMLAVDDELTAEGAGGDLAAESLANVLAVQLIRHVRSPRRNDRGRDRVLPRGRLRAVVEYIQEHLDAGPTLDQMAAIAQVSPYHFARQFKAATGLPPHQFVIARRIERAQQLLQQDGDASLADVAARAGFSD